jgi:hypothetical protein
MNHVNIWFIANTMVKMSPYITSTANPQAQTCTGQPTHLWWAAADSRCIIWLVLQHSSIIQCRVEPWHKDFFNVSAKLTSLTFMLCLSVDILTTWCTLYLCEPLECGNWVQIYELHHKIMQFLSVHWVSCPEMNILTGGWTLLTWQIPCIWIKKTKWFTQWLLYV